MIQIGDVRFSRDADGDVEVTVPDSEWEEATYYLKREEWEQVVAYLREDVVA